MRISLIFQAIESHPHHHPLSSQKKGRKIFNYIKMTNMYKGEPIKKDGFRFLTSCSSLIFLNVKICTDFDFLLIFWLSRSNTCPQRVFEFMVLFQMIKLFEDPGNMFDLLSLCVLWGNLCFYHFILALPRNCLWTNWKENWKPCLEQYYMRDIEFCLLSAFYSWESSVSILVSVL